MKLISHRGNLRGPDPERDNNPECITEVLGLGFDCEIDLWGIDGLFYLGHDKPVYEVSLAQLERWKKNVWIHAKNEQALNWLIQLDNDFNFFWHDKDSFTITRNGTLWCYPSFNIYQNGINLMPEWNAHTKEKLKGCLGVCSDYIMRYL